MACSRDWNTENQSTTNINKEIASLGDQYGELLRLSLSEPDKSYFTHEEAKPYDDFEKHMDEFLNKNTDNIDKTRSHDNADYQIRKDSFENFLADLEKYHVTSAEFIRILKDSRTAHHTNVLERESVLSNPLLSIREKLTLVLYGEMMKLQDLGEKTRAMQVSPCRAQYDKDTSRCADSAIIDLACAGLTACVSPAAGAVAASAAVAKYTQCMYYAKQDLQSCLAATRDNP